MSDLMHHDADEAFHEIQLSGKQLVFLFMATTIVAVVIFLCGVQVGRGVKTERAAEGNEPVAAATTPAAPPAASVAPAEPPPASEPPPPAKEGEEDLTYAQRLQADAAPTEKVKPRPEPPTAARSSSPPAPAEPAPSRTTTAAPSGRPGAWVVQVQALKGSAAASALAQRLAGKGYPAFVLNPGAGAPPIYRVQVGRYNDRREAEQVARRLEKEEQFKPWISR